MTLVGVNVRRTLGLLLSVVLLFGATTVIASQSAEAAYPGGNDWIVFSNSSDGDSDLYVAPIGGGTPTNVTNSLYFQSDPVFSPDGTKLAFASNHEGTSSIYVAEFDPTGPSLNAEGSWVRVSSGATDGEPTWSPDGTTIAFQRRFDFTVSGTATATHATNLVDAAATFLTDGVDPGFAVDNTTAVTSGLVTSVDQTTLVTDIAWTTGDAYSIAVVHRQLFTAASDGSDAGSETQLGGQGSTPAFSDTQPVWSPDGTLLAFTSTEDGLNSDILTMTPTDTTGASRTNLTTAGTLDAVASYPAWSPDGTHIAFQIQEEEGQPTADNFNIWTITSAGADESQITTGAGDEVEPAWSPDGTLIAYRDVPTGAVYGVASSGGAGSAVTTADTPTGDHNTPDWQPTLAAVNDAASVDEDGSVNIDVLANDLPLVDDVGTLDSSATLITEPTKGTAVRQGDGSFIYTHTGPEIGVSSTTDTFEYEITQGSFSSTAEVTVTINPVDNAPTAVDDEYSAGHGASLTVTSANGVLTNDSDPEGSGLTAVKVSDPAHGTLTLNADGSFTYTNDGASDDAVVDTFTYMANDGTNNSAPATVTINVAALNPDPPSVTVDGPSFGGPGMEASFTSAVTAGFGPRVYDWSVMLGGSEVATGTATTLDFTPTQSGAYTVELTVTDDAGAGTGSHDFTVLTDISGSIFASDIVWLANEGVTKGCNPPTNDEYCPNSNVTRGQMAAFLVRFLGLTDQNPAIDFVDDNGSIFEDNIEKLATAGITKGCNPPTNDAFCPNDYVTRGQMAAFLVRALSLTDNGGGNLFTDDDGSVFENNIDIFATAGITKGCNAAGDEFCPNDYVTRGQMAAFLHRADGLK